MKFGINLYLWADDMHDGLMPVLERLKQIGFDGVEVPIFEEAEPGHRVACHFWREIVPPPQILPSAEAEAATPRLKRLQAYFTRRADEPAVPAGAR